jgi:hypothetical protein
MAETRRVEIFSAGCPVCLDLIERVRALACESCVVLVRDMREMGTSEYAKSLGVRSLPAVAINGKLADCCAGRGPDEDTLRAAGLGQPL